MNIKEATKRLDKQIDRWRSAIDYDHSRGYANGQVAGLIFAKRVLDEISVGDAQFKRVLEAKLEELQEDRKSMWDARLDRYVATIDAKIETVKELLAEIG